MTLTLAFSAALIEWSEVRANKSEQTSICPGKDFMDEMLSAIHRGKQAFKHLMRIGRKRAARVRWPAARRPLVLNIPPSDGGARLRRALILPQRPEAGERIQTPDPRPKTPSETADGAI